MRLRACVRAKGDADVSFSSFLSYALLVYYRCFLVCQWVSMLVFSQCLLCSPSIRIAFVKYIMAFAFEPMHMTDIMYDGMARIKETGNNGAFDKFN